ncbi:hypothetical protein ACHBTE_15555 [Streptomyces sp. M41]|uniref:hypothetical protein n=1 Tax=Streptomyces sp. M41 TaxID=3059412 RepID=UPI00374C9629
MTVLARVEVARLHTALDRTVADDMERPSHEAQGEGSTLFLGRRQPERAARETRGRVLADSGVALSTRGQDWS